MKNKYLNYIIFGLIIIVSGIIVYLLLDNFILHKKPVIEFKLNGKESIVHNMGDPYIDLGVTITKDGEDISNDVTVENEVDVNKEGIYTIKYHYEELTLARIVEIKELNSFNLVGDDIVYLLLNGKYNDPKVKIKYNNEDVSSKVVIDSNLDTSKVGKYTIKYSYDELNKVLERQIYVSDFSEYFIVNYDKENTLDSA